MADSDDEEVLRAIAISLGKPDPKVGSSVQDAVELDTASDSDQPSKAKESKLGETDKAPVMGHGLLGLDRKQMEMERLARKRRRSLSSDSGLGKALLKDSKHMTKKSFRQGGDSKTATNLEYPNGVVKKTWAFRQTRLGDDIKLEEVLQKDDLQLAVLSSFQWDVPWVTAKIDMNRTKIVLIMQAKEQSIQAQYRQEISSMRNVRLCFPSMAGQINCMHSKLMLLSHQHYLRIVLPTANLMSYDWGETGQMENSVFMIDLPRLEEDARADDATKTAFAQDLEYFLNAQGLERDIVRSLRNFNFAKTEQFAFIHTIGGAHTGSSWSLTGYPGLARAVTRLDLRLATPSVDFVTSSVGSLDLTFLSTLYEACSGENGQKDYARRSASSSKDAKELPADLTDTVRENFRIFFPTHETVTSSIARSAGTICMQSSYWNNPKFPQNLLRDCQSVRPGVLMHNKIIYVRPTTSKGTSLEAHGPAWAYVGSANCSQSAWGNRLVKDRVTGGPRLNCRNWECGVLFPIVGAEAVGKDQSSDLRIFEASVPVPMKFPGEEYGTRRPWFFMEQ